MALNSIKSLIVGDADRSILVVPGRPDNYKKQCIEKKYCNRSKDKFPALQQNLLPLMNKNNEINVLENVDPIDYNISIAMPLNICNLKKLNSRW